MTQPTEGPSRMTVVPRSRSYEIVDTIAEWMTPAFSESAEEHDRQIGWTLYAAPMVTGQRDNEGNQQHVTVLVLYVEIQDPSAEMGYLSSTTVLPMSGWDVEEAQRQVQLRCQELVEALPAAKAEREAAEAHATSQGRVPPSSGLVPTNGRSYTPSDGDVTQEAVDAFVRGD